MARKIDWLDRIKRKQAQLDQVELQLLEYQEKKEKLLKELDDLQQKYTTEMLVTHNLTIEDLATIINQATQQKQESPEEIETKMSEVSEFVRSESFND